MKILSLILVLVLSSVGFAAGNLCLITDNLTGAAVDHDSLILSDTSHQNYRVTFTNVCHSLGTTDQISLIGASTNGSDSSMLCPGNLILVGSESCWVKDIELISN
ncbi:MAG: hypothetical protein ACXWQQ_16900 [Pseudobdellovibrio sp.]